MGRFVKGDVIVLPFPFTDLMGKTRRPAVVVANLSGDDQIVCQITKERHSDSYSINLSNSDFSQGNLPIPNCYIRPNKLFTADNKIIIKKRGQLNDVKTREIIDGIRLIIR